MFLPNFDWIQNLFLTFLGCRFHLTVSIFCHCPAAAVRKLGLKDPTQFQIRMTLELTEKGEKIKFKSGLLIERGSERRMIIHRESKVITLSKA